MQLLVSLGFSVRGADNGETAIRTWEEWRPHLILMDTHMPVMDGLEATRRIKANRHGKDTIIVVLSASAMDENRRLVAASGADDFVAKPCREDDLLQKLQVLLNLDYEYQEVNEDAQSAPLSAEALGNLPLALVEQLSDATLNGQNKRLHALILQVRQTGESETANALQELIEKYDYDTLERLLEEASHQRTSFGT